MFYPMNNPVSQVRNENGSKAQKKTQTVFWVVSELGSPVSYLYAARKRWSTSILALAVLVMLEW